jgi:TRAP-type C4-dicarboxylate transport system substrate-binding protein
MNCSIFSENLFNTELNKKDFDLVSSLDKFKNLVIRIPPSNDFQASMKALGANPQFFTMNEVYDVLKNRIVEAQENPLSIIKGFKLYEVTKYLNMTNHAWSGYNTFFNLKFWQQLSASNRKVIAELLRAYQGKQLIDQQNYNNSLYTEVTEKYGMIATHPDCSQSVQKLIPIYKSIYTRLNPQAQLLIKSKLEQVTGVKFN